MRAGAGLVIVLWFLAAPGCGGDSAGSPGGSSSDQAATDPIQGLESGRWNWVAFPESRCGDGSTTGIGIHPGSSDVLVFLEGGGACWSWKTCFGTPTIFTRGPFGEDQLRIRQAFTGGSVLDPDGARNPFQGWTLVFVPYCTGDVHAGNRVATYTDPDGRQVTFQHVGHANLVAFVRRLAATYPEPTRLVVSGASAGGFGSVVSYPTFRASWPDVRSYLVDDSGPFVSGLTGELADSFYSSWGAEAAIDPWCADCRSDLASVHAALAERYPDDRLALLSFTHDAVIAGYFQMAPSALAGELAGLAAGLAGLPGWRWYYEAGTGHTMLGYLDGHDQNGVPVSTFLEQMIEDDPAWAPVTPP